MKNQIIRNIGKVLTSKNRRLKMKSSISREKNSSKKNGKESILRDSGETFLDTEVMKTLVMICLIKMKTKFETVK